MISNKKQIKDDKIVSRLTLSYMKKALIFCACRKRECSSVPAQNQNPSESESKSESLRNQVSFRFRFWFWFRFRLPVVHLVIWWLIKLVNIPLIVPLSGSFLCFPILFLFLCQSVGAFGSNW